MDRLGVLKILYGQWERGNLPDFLAAWTFQDDRVVRVDISQDRDAGLAAARSASQRQPS